MTRMKLRRWNYCPLNISIVSSTLANNCNLDVFQDKTLGSDPVPVFTEMYVSPLQCNVIIMDLEGIKG